MTIHHCLIFPCPICHPNFLVKKPEPVAVFKQPEQHIEQRIMYVMDYDDVRGLGIPCEFRGTNDGWFPGSIEGVANYSYLMNNAIVWVEERVIYEPEPWETASLDDLDG